MDSETFQGTRKRSKVYKNFSREESSDEEDDELESFLFGTSKKKNKITEDTTEETITNKATEPEDLLSFMISTKPSDQYNNGDKKVKLSSDKNENQPILLQTLEKKAAWEDPDDENIRVNLHAGKLKKLKKSNAEKSISGRTFQSRLKENYEKAVPAPAWADITADEENDEDKLFRTTSNLLTKSTGLPSGLLDHVRRNDLNKYNPERSGITSIEFHPAAKIAFIASMSKRLTIIQADGEENKKLQSIFLDNFPITSAHFTNLGNKIVMTGNKKYFYVFDLIAGQITKVPGLKGKSGENLDKFTVSPDGKEIAFLGADGFLHLVSTETYHYKYSLKMNGSINAATYQSNDIIFTTGGDGEVYIWDTRKRKCIHRFVDQGSIGSTCIACSNNKKFVAVGSNCGVVNVYNESSIKLKDPDPVKVLKNLTTEIEGVKFNSTSELLVFYSSLTRNGVKLCHFPSMTVYNNFPNPRYSVGHISCADFSPMSGYLSTANDNGKAYLYRLNHFPDA